MRSLSVRVLALLLACLMPAGIVRAGGWPEMEAPPRARVQAVAEDMKYNGVPMRIRKFTSDASAESVLAFYRQRWNEGAKLKPVLNTLGEWQIIGRQSGDYYQTVQVKPRESGGSEGLLGATKLPSLTERPNVDTNFPRMPGTQVISDVDSSDDGRVAKTLILKNDHSVTSNVSFYQSTMPTQDWRQNLGFGRNQNNHSSQALYFERRKESANVTINHDPKGGTMVVINIVTSSL